MEPVPAAKKDIVWRYLQFYLYEHAAFTGKRPVDGVFEYPWFDAYWQEGAQRWPFWARMADDVVALALVRFDEDDGCHQMAEFFVVNRYRGQSLGDRFAKDVILRFEGPWKLDQAKRNERASAFWRRVLGDIADYAEAPLDRGDGVERIEQRFEV
jgi:predicted acetyltransferase